MSTKLPSIKIRDSYRDEHQYPKNKFWFYLVINEYYEDISLLDPFLQLIVNFGKTLGDKAEVNIPIKSAYSKIRREVLMCLWDHKLWEEFDKTKEIYFLVLQIPLSSFQPHMHKSIIIDFPSAINNPMQYVAFLNELAIELKNDSNIFDWYSNEWKPNSVNKLLRKIYNAIEVKPGFLGFTIDLKKLLREH